MVIKNQAYRFLAWLFRSMWLPFYEYVERGNLGGWERTESKLQNLIPTASCGDGERGNPMKRLDMSAGGKDLGPPRALKL